MCLLILLILQSLGQNNIFWISRIDKMSFLVTGEVLGRTTIDVVYQDCMILLLYT